MAQTNYSKHVEHNVRRVGVMSRAEYQSRRTEFAPRGQDSPNSKLVDLDVITIRSAARQRKALMKHIKENLSNEALAKQFGTHVSNIEKILSRAAWSHVA